MMSGRIEYEIAFLALVCTLSIFLFPAVQGPYSAVHGPVTTLLSMRLGARLRLGILAAAFSVLSTSLRLALVLVRGRDLPDSDLVSASLVTLTNILRC